MTGEALKLHRHLALRVGAPAELVISRVRALDPSCGVDTVCDLVVRGGRIAELAAPGTAEADAGERIDGDGKCVFPAFVDPHVHLRTPGREDEEDLESGTRAAAAGGFCCVIAMPNTEPVVDSPELIHALRAQAMREARVQVGFAAAITVGQQGERLTDMAALADAGALCLSDDGLPVRSPRLLRQALQYQRLHRVPLALHEEDPELSAGGAMHEGEVALRLGVSGIPSASEATMVARDLLLAELEGGRIHVQHVSARQTLALVEWARERGVAVSCEVTPHHLLLCEDDVADLDTSRKMNPPLRSADDREALIEALRSGAIDCVATDHAPHAAAEKEQPFELAPMGTTGLETAFAVLYDGLVRPGRITLATLVDRLTAGAPLFGIERPTLSVGATANLCLVDLDAEWTVGENGFESRSANNAFLGRKVHGRVLLTTSAGQVAWRDRSILLKEVPA
ncbi:dihydroorotase [Thermoleophilum album]|uniref:Dihydroorotase n=1 Tax=Thermoleophilum album TaxID=29539 RepID=A0A1H6FU12_THEAL|nr:dihydroorotase [Thermoleophilum album]SEH14296.1 dihydroorotase [Thermoleophilum album]